jgi:hypothetical protein
MIKSRQLISILLFWLSGCAALSGHSDSEWQCYGTATAGDVVAMSFRNIKPDGTVGTSSHGWEWDKRGEDADIRLEQPRGFDEDRPWIVLNLKKGNRHRIFGVELRAGDDPAAATDPGLRILGQREQYIFTPTLQTLLSLSRPVSAVAYDRQGSPAFRISIDVDAVARGAEAMAKADASSLEAMRDYRTACHRLANEAIVIT